MNELKIRSRECFIRNSGHHVLGVAEDMTLK